MATSNSWQRTPANISARWAENALGSSAFGEWALIEKRLLDIVISTLALMVLAPVMLLIAVAIKLESPGPVFYISRRWGRHGRAFDCIKFRTMVEQGRETRFGSWLRRYALDELPQLSNVLRGKMSVVGPRPLLASERGGSNPVALRRFEFKPGMTGLWHVQGWQYQSTRGYISPEATYRKNWSMWLDLTIMVRSVGVALAGRGC
ncbi:MAG TPA: sugar transferase [Terracidiphilus sp.]|jgi:lipopolysaccharide/colanic/teichoic acid biosynthesis glycosyltransferase|nr:sugar transferase [Terracidiphilus sp.]